LHSSRLLASSYPHRGHRGPEADSVILRQICVTVMVLINFIHWL